MVNYSYKTVCLHYTLTICLGFAAYFNKYLSYTIQVQHLAPGNKDTGYATVIFTLLYLIAENLKQLFAAVGKAECWSAPILRTRTPSSTTCAYSHLGQQAHEGAQHAQTLFEFDWEASE